MSLSDVKIRNSKPKEKPVKLFDGSGLFLINCDYQLKCWMDVKIAERSVTGS